MSPARKTLFTALLLFLFVLAYYLPAFNAKVFAMDEGMLLIYPELVLQGKLPYRDFESFYAPGNILVLSAVYSLVGCHVSVERTVGFIYLLLLFSGLFVLMHRRSPGLAAGAVVLCALLLRFTGVVAFAWTGAMALALWSILLLAGPPARWRSLTAGLLAGAALLYRQDIGLAVVASAIPLWLLLPRNQRWTYLLGTAGALLPMLWITLAAGAQSVFENLFTLPVLITNSGRRIPFSQGPPYAAVLFLYSAAAAAINVLAGCLAVRNDRQAVPPRLLLSAALLGLGCIHQALQRMDMVHVLFGCFFSISLLPLALWSLLSAIRGRQPHCHSGWVLSGALILTLIFANSQGRLFWAKYLPLVSQPITFDLKANGREVPVGNAQAALNEIKLIDYLTARASPGERIFIGPKDLRRTPAADVYLYHFLPTLIPASYFIELNPLSANAQNSRLAADLQSADWLLLNSQWSHWNEPNESTRYGPDAPNEVVRKHFLLRKRAGDLEVFERADRPPKSQQQ